MILSYDYRARSLRPLRARPWTRWTCTAALVTSLAGMTGCFDRPVDDAPIGGSGELPVTVPLAVNRNLDLLFVIDDSESMKNEQDALAEKFRLLIQQIESAKYGMPNLHIGVVFDQPGRAVLPGRSHRRLRGRWRGRAAAERAAAAGRRGRAHVHGPDRPLHR